MYILNHPQEKGPIKWEAVNDFKNQKKNWQMEVIVCFARHIISAPNR